MKINCNPFIVWLFGIPGSGKSTMAKKLSSVLISPHEIIDSDVLRERLTPNPTWSDEERLIFYNSIIEIATRLFKHNISSIISASAGGIDIDKYITILPSRTFVVYVDCDIENASKRHPKALYSNAVEANLKLPIIRSTKSGVINMNDLRFSEANNINGYKIVIPEKIDLTVNTNDINSIDNNLQSLIRILK